MLSRYLKGALPTFKETSSPDLNDILASFRNAVFVPSHLLKLQKDYIYKAKYKPMLESQAIYAEIGDEKIQLRHIDKLRDMPNIRGSINRMLDLMEKTGDWSNLPACLEGLQTAKALLANAILEKIARRANESGRQDVVMDCIRRASKTNYVLKNRDVVREVMLGAHLRAQQAGWEEVPTRKALAQAEQVAELLEDPAHTGGSKVGKTDPRAQPDIIGIVLELAGVRASRHLSGKDEDGKVLAYAERLIATWGNADVRLNRSLDANKTLSMWVPAWHGLKLAAEILEPESSACKQLPEVFNALEGYLARAKNVLVSHELKKKWRGLLMYDAILNQ